MTQESHPYVGKFWTAGRISPASRADLIPRLEEYLEMLLRASLAFFFKFTASDESGRESDATVVSSR
jgi:hypothetical protein